MAKLDDKEFDIIFESIDTDHNGELSLDELVTYCSFLHESTKEDFGHSIAKILEGGSNEDVAALWSKLDLNGDGVVSLEELAHFVSSEIVDFSSKKTDLLHHIIDTNGDGVISFTEFESYLYSLRKSQTVFA